MRLLLRNSEELYNIFRTSMLSKANSKGNFKTLTYMLEGGSFEKTEASLLNRIIDIGGKIEVIIENNAGLIDDEKLSMEMVILSTHVRIMRMANEGKFDNGKEIAQLFTNRTFPNEILEKVDLTFNELKDRLNVLNEKKIK
jgi:hypothetical protein